MPHTAAALLLAARRDPSQLLTDLPEALRPADRAAAYVIQAAVMAELGEIGGWKVGSPSPDGPIQCGPLPASGIMASPAQVPSEGSRIRGLEAEICFRMAHDLPPRGTPYTREEVVAAISAAHPAIELLESRFVDPDAISPFTNLADTQSHGAFIYGPGLVDWHGIDFAAETVTQSVDGTVHMQRTGNPCGDMLRLMVWMANEGAVWAGGLKAGQFVTCGSWTGKSSVGAHAKLHVSFPSVGEAAVDYMG
jgi:2-keto-4-pentenoate hydratase